MNKILAAALVLAAAPMAGAQVNFDKGVDVKAFAAQAAAVKAPEAKFGGIPTYSTQDCKRVEFTAGSPLTSADISLRSMEMYQDCINMGSPVGQICTPRPEYYSETTRVIVTEPRELQPGQKEVFDVCLWGKFLNLRTVSAVYKYKVKTTFDGIYITPKGLVGQAKSAVTLKEGEPVSQDTVNKFNQVKNELWRLESDTTWLRSDMDRLESTARRIAQTNSADPFFQNDLQRMAFDVSRYNNSARQLRDQVRNLLALAQKDAALNKIAGDIEMDARTLLNRAQFDVENTAQRLEWAVRSARPELVGYNAQWQAMDISRYSRELTWSLRDLSFDARDLVNKTRP